MIAKSPKERELYEARLKLQRDERARLKAAEDQGLAKGETTGQVKLLQRLLGLPVSPSEELAGKPYEELRHMLSELERQYEERNLS